MRDTIASFGTNRPPRVLDSDFDVAPLTLADFDYQEAGPSNEYGITLPDLSVQNQLALICIHMAAICRIIGRVLRSAYLENPMGNIDTLYFNSVPESGRTRLDPRTFKSIEEDFRQWKANVPEEVLHLSPTPAPDTMVQQAPLLHRAMISMMYHTGLIMLHRQTDSSVDQDARDQQSTGFTHPATPRALVRMAAAQVNKITMDIYQADLMKYLPATGISCLFPVSISHIFDMWATDAKTRHEARQRLEECKQALRELADAHISAEWAVNFLTYVGSLSSSIPNVDGKRLNSIEGKLRFADPNMLQGQAASQTPQRDESLAENSSGALPGHLRPSADPELAFVAGSDRDQTAEQVTHFMSTPNFFSNTTHFPEAWLGLTDILEHAYEG